MKKLAWTGGVLLLLLLAPLAAFAAHHVNGTWQLDVTLGDGQGGSATLTLQEGDGGKLTGKYNGALGEVELTGKVDGNNVEVSFESQAGAVTYKGTVTGDTIEGTCTYGQLGEGTFKGKKTG
jgi:hypothetical protein